MADDRNKHAADAAAVDSHAGGRKPRAKRPLPAAAQLPQNPLPLPPEVPLHLKLVLSYAEAAALGIAPERSLRRLVAVGRVKRSVIRAGRRVGFVRDLLIAELLAVGE